MTSVPPDKSSLGTTDPSRSLSFEGDERFEIRSTLGRGTSSVVYRAFDRQRGVEVALKVLGVQGSSSRLAFKREFRSMADVAHPNLVKLYELHAAGNDLMFTMELVDGNDFLGYVRRPKGAAPDWNHEYDRPPAPDRITIAEWSGPAPDHIPVGSSGALVYFPPLTPEQIPTLRTMTAQLVRGLMALHEAGHIHRDIKPSNVLIDDSGRVVLLDFGVAAQITGVVPAAGTPAYMSPEQAQGKPPSPSADFYAVGVMLYEALTGRLPHSYDDPVGDKLQRDPMPPSAYEPEVPIDLDRLCMALLARDPAARPLGIAILDLLCGDSEQSLPPRTRTEVPVVGRNAEFQRLEEAMHRASNGDGRVVLVAGRSGIGKSVLIRQFLARKRREGVVVFTGRCYEQESVPYKALDVVMDAICQHLASIPLKEREELMPRHRWALGRLFPVLAQFDHPPAPHQPPPSPKPQGSNTLQQIRQQQTVTVSRPQTSDTKSPPPLEERPSPPLLPPASAIISPGTYDNGPLDPELAARSTLVVGAPPPNPTTVTGPAHPIETTNPSRIRRQGVSALRQLLESLAWHSPLLIAIDDLQWGDVDSAQVLAEVFDPPLPPLLLLGSYRREDEETSGFLRNFLAAQVNHEILSLGPLEADAALELATELVDHQAPVSASQVAHEANGDPFLLVELAHYVSSLDGVSSLGDLPAQGLTVEAVVRARIQRLDAPARRLLEVVAIAAGPVPRTVARQAADLGVQENSALVQLRTSHLLRVKGTRGVETIETYHDRIRDTVQAQLSEDERRDWHLRLVHALKVQSHLDHERIGKHLEASRHIDEAIPYYLEAAAAATVALAFDRAAKLYQHILGLRGLPHAQEIDIRKKYAVVLMRQGRFDEAASELDQTQHMLAPGVERARVFYQLGEVELNRGGLYSAIVALERALDDLGQPVPDNPRELLISNVRELGVQLRNTYFPPAHARAPAQPTERLAMRVYNRLSHAYYLSRGHMQVFWPHLRELNAAERHPPTPELGRAYAGHGTMLTALPWFRRALAYIDRGLEIQRNLGNRLGEAQALHQRGIVLYGASQFAEAARVSTVAAERLESIGDVRAALDALLHAAIAMYRLGRSDEATRIARRVHEEALEAGDISATATSILVWSYASGGRVPSVITRVHIDISEQIGHYFTKLVTTHAEGIRCLGAGRIAEAATIFDQTAAELRQRGMLSAELLSSLDTWRATAWRRVAERTTEPRDRTQAFHLAARHLRRGLWSAGRFRNSLPHALREAGRQAAQVKQMRRARYWFDASLSVALKQEQTLEVAMTRIVRELCLGTNPAATASVLQTTREAHGPALDAGFRLEGDPRAESGGAEDPSLG